MDICTDMYRLNGTHDLTADAPEFQFVHSSGQIQAATFPHALYDFHLFMV